MAKLAELTIAGASGTKYTFGVYSFNSTWAEVAGVYLVTRRSLNEEGTGTHTFIYVGETENLKERHLDHHKADCFLRHGANCLCFLSEKSEPKRKAIEADLLAAKSWSCNG